MPNNILQKRPNNYFDGLPLTTRHKCLFLIIMLAYFFEQMDNWNFSFIAPAILSSWNVSEAEGNMFMGRIGFWYFIGMTLGGFMGGLISDLIGRKKTFLLSIAIFSIGSLINALPTSNKEIFIAARALTGFGVFCLMVCSQAYIAEISPAESRGKWQSLIAAVGFLAVPFIALLCRLIVPVHPEAWRTIFYIGGLGFIGLFIAHKYLIESPRWLVEKNRLEEAEQIISQVTNTPISLEGCATNRHEKASVLQVVMGMFSRQYLRRTLLLILIFICINPASFIFTFWSSKLFNTVYSQTETLSLMTLISCGVPAGCFLASMVSDLGGRKIPMALMFAAEGVVALTLRSHIDNFYMVAILGFILNALSLGGTFILFSYAAEQYPTRIRNTATGIHNGLSRFAVSGIQMMVPTVFLFFGGQNGSPADTISVWLTMVAIFILIPVMPILVFGIRTGGRALEDIS